MNGKRPVSYTHLIVLILSCKEVTSYECYYKFKNSRCQYFFKKRLDLTLFASYNDRVVNNGR